jgi:putative YphP/YqiW family bacilliredoxin
MPYPEEMVAPLREELLRHGVTELRDGRSVDDFMAAEGSTLIFFNSVCGCAAGSARPGLAMALTGQALPDRIGTVFAGQDVEATERARSFLDQVPPSSPSAALFRDGELVHFIPRHLIEGQAPETVAGLFTESFTEFCS